MTDAKRCPRCGYVQIIEAFPLHAVRGEKRRSSWCVECWADHRVQQTGRIGQRAEQGR